MKQKIFCVGFNKTGTTTLNSIFRDQLGYKALHKGRWTYWSADRSKSRIDRWDTFTDGETPLINKLEHRYPNSLFILNTRPLKSWLISRHKAAERSKAAINWIFSKYLPFGKLGKKLIDRLIPTNHETLQRWIQIRNSYHKFVLDQFREKGNLLVTNIESENMPDQLENFLRTGQKINPAWANQEGNADGQGSKPSRILDIIGESVSSNESKSYVDDFFTINNIEGAANCLTFFDDKDYHLSKSRADKILYFLPFLKFMFRYCFLFFVRKRGKAKNFVSKWFYDSLIGWFRSERDLNYYTSIHYHI